MDNTFSKKHCTIFSQAIIFTKNNENLLIFPIIESIHGAGENTLGNQKRNRKRWW